MTNSVKRLVQNELAHVSSIVGRFARYQDWYLDECNKSSSNYDVEKASKFMRNALIAATELQDYCKNEGYELREVYSDCEIFLEEYDRPYNW